MLYKLNRIKLLWKFLIKCLLASIRFCFNLVRDQQTITAVHISNDTRIIITLWAVEQRCMKGVEQSDYLSILTTGLLLLCVVN